MKFTTPNGTHTTIISIARNNPTARQALILLMEANLQSYPENFVNAVAWNQDPVTLIVLAHLHPNAALAVLNRNKEKPKPLFNIVWNEFVQTASAHGVMALVHKEPDLSAFLDWAMSTIGIQGNILTKPWQARYVTKGYLEARRERQISNQAQRGRAKGPIGGDPLRRPQK